MNRDAHSFDLPPQMSTLAPEVDWMYDFIWWTSVISFVLIVGTMIVFVVLYRRRPGRKALPSGHNDILEVVWTVAPLVLLVFLFHRGFTGYLFGSIAPADSLVIHVRAKQWSWEFEHWNGLTETNEIHVPVHQPVKLVMASMDVLHSFFVPEFRVKRDVVPGMTTTLWFEAIQETGDAPVHVFCAEYCGAPVGITASAERNTNHSTMLADLHIVTREAYDTLLREGPPMPADCEGAPNPNVCWGEKLYGTLGCRSCHSTDPNVQIPAPSWGGLFGHQVPLEGGATAVADENYIRESILQPQAKIVRGFGNIRMPPANPPEKQIQAIIAYIQSLAE